MKSRAWWRGCLALWLAALPLAALAQGATGYPSKPIRWIVPWPPGGGADVLSRMLSPQVSEALKQQIVIDNRGGAAGNIGAEIAAKSPPDGYTVVFAYSGTHAINPSIYGRMPFKERDFAPIIWLSSVPQVLVVHPSLPVRSVKDLIALAKAKPGELTYASSGSGAFNHLTGALFATMTGTKLVHVPYKGGGPAAVALLSGDSASPPRWWASSGRGNCGRWPSPAAGARWDCRTCRPSPNRVCAATRRRRGTGCSHRRARQRTSSSGSTPSSTASSPSPP
ncbi:MAG: tripartite tricarboxylate transporter substrate binding protein [Betaproteobacteria bacterium]|nr:tripartite tricarboxylate transporter substrate binding protein [Betaproteobacteria bacterium]